MKRIARVILPDVMEIEWLPESSSDPRIMELVVKELRSKGFIDALRETRIRPKTVSRIAAACRRLKVEYV